MTQTLFEQRLSENLQDVEFRHSYEREMREIARVQKLLTQVDAAREAAGFSKNSLARATGTHPAAVRRLLTSGSGNPTLRAFLSMLDATGLDVKLVQKRKRERRARNKTLVQRTEHATVHELAAASR